MIFPLVAQPGRRRIRGGKVVAGGVIGAVLAVLLVAAANQLRDQPTAGKLLSPAAVADDPGPGRAGADRSRRVSVFDLEPGTCLADLGAATNTSEVSEVSVVLCDVEHVAEVAATLRMPDGPWPGALAVEEFAADRCVPEIRDAGADVGDDLQWSYFGPSENSWSVRADRTVSCLVVKGGPA